MERRGMVFEERGRRKRRVRYLLQRLMSREMWATT
jgi:hypothetical protein